MADVTKTKPYDPVDAMEAAWEEIYDKSPDDRVVEATGGMVEAKMWLTKLLRKAYNAGFKEGEEYGKVPF